VSDPIWLLGEPPDYKPIPQNSAARIADLELENAALKQALSLSQTDRMIAETRLKCFMDQWKSYGWLTTGGRRV
jgi:hypothetical protein